MRSLALALVLAAVPAAADPAPAPAKVEAAKAAPTKCKPVVIGRGLDRKVVCQIEAPIIVKQESPKPKVVIVHDGGKRVVGPPKLTDPLIGLSHTLD
jgi:hypothetical protein